MDCSHYYWQQCSGDTTTGSNAVVTAAFPSIRQPDSLERHAFRPASRDAGHDGDVHRTSRHLQTPPPGQAPSWCLLTGPAAEADRAPKLSTIPLLAAKAWTASTWERVWSRIWKRIVITAESTDQEAPLNGSSLHLPTSTFTCATRWPKSVGGERGEAKGEGIGDA